MTNVFMSAEEWAAFVAVTTESRRPPRVLVFNEATS